MNIFLLLCLSFLLSLSDSSPQPSRKRSLQDDANQQNSVVSKRPKIDANSNAKIFKLPEQVLAHVGTFLENPFETLSPVSVDFRQAMKCFTPNFLLQSRTIFDNFDKIPVSLELARLLKLDPIYLNSKFEELLFPGSIFIPTSPVLVEYAAKVIKSRLSLNPFDKSIAFLLLLDRLIQKEQFDSILVLLKCVPELKFVSLTVSDFLTNFVSHIFKSKDFQNFLVLKAALTGNTFPLFLTLAAFPVPLEDFIDEAFDQELVLSAFAASCVINLPISLTEEQEEFIKLRNFQIISNFSKNQNSPEILVEFVRLCTDLRYSKQQNQNFQISNEFLNGLNAFADNRRIKFYLEILILISLIRGNQRIFLQIIKTRRVTLNSVEICELLKKSPEFIKILSPSQFKRIYGIKNQLFLLENDKISKEEIPLISNVYERIRVLLSSCFMGEIETETEIKKLYRIFNFSISKLIKRIIKETNEKDVADKIHKILSALKDEISTKQEETKIARALGIPKYLNSLLKSGNDEILIFPSENVFVIVDGENFKEILEISSLLKQEKAKNLLQRFLVNWKNVFSKNHLFPNEIVKFFDIFNIEIGDFDVNYTKTYVETANLILKDSRILFKNPEHYSKYVDLMLISIAYKCNYEDLINNQWIQLDRSNPFLFKSYGIFKLWLEKNLKSFISQNQTLILKAFIPKIPNYFIDEIFFDPRGVELSLIETVLLILIPRDEQIKIELKTVQNLRIFYYDLLPRISNLLKCKANYKIVINWMALIEDSGTLIDFEIILSLIKPEELCQLFKLQNQSEKLQNLFYYYIDTRKDRNFPQFNRDLLK